MASTSTSTSPEDLCSQWTALDDKDLTVAKVEELLRPIPDDLWVATACADCILDDATIQRSVLDLGIERTTSAVKRAHEAYSRRSPPYEEEDLSQNASAMGTTAEAKAQEDATRHASLVSHFRDEPADAQLCLIRAVLLDRLDRLSTFVEIYEETHPKETEETLDEEWEDDPWADGASDTATKPPPSVSEPPLPLSIFLTSDLLRLACLLACSEHPSSLRILMNRHGHHLWPYRFLIMDSVPEYALATQYRDILPTYNPSDDKEQRPSPDPWRTGPDFSECTALSTALVDATISLSFAPVAPATTALSTRPEPLSSQELVTWYQGRIDSIVSSTGMVDAALLLVQHAAAQGLPGLDEVGEELSLLSRLVYDASTPVDADEDWTLTRWRSMEPSAVVHAYLTHSTPETVARDISRLVMPYLFVLESRAERAGSPDPSLPTRLLYEYVLNARLDIVAAILEASKPTLSPAQRVIRNDEDMARLALACLYGSDSLDEWPTMSRIFECLPAWDAGNDEDDADEADTTIASLGAFVVPSTTRFRATPADLMLFFQPLPSSALSRALDVLDVHLESGEILARWGVPAPLRWFLQSNGHIAEQRSWANRIARRAGGTDNLDTQEDWEWLLEDMLKLSEEGDSGAWSAFCLLSKDDIIRIYFSGLLSTGRFDIAKQLLRSSSVSVSLEPSVIEDICLTCSQEFYDNASSGNYHFGDMKLAYECLDIPASSERVVREKEFIEATTRLCSFHLTSRPGIPITPLEIRLTKDRLSLVSRVLSSNSDAYKHTQVILDLAHKLGFRGDIVAEVKTMAMLVETAVQAEDFTRAFGTSQTMIDTVLNLRASALPDLHDANVEEASEVCWVACYQLGRHPEFEDVQKKLVLLGRALELCPPDRMADVLAVWYRLEDDDLQQRRERVEARHKGGRTMHARKRVPTVHDPVASLTSRLQHLRMPEFQMPHSPLTGAEDAAALAGKAFNRVTANFPFSVGNRARTSTEEDGGSREGSRTRGDTPDVSAQASRVLQAGIGWLLGGDEDS